MLIRETASCRCDGTTGTPTGGALRNVASRTVLRLGAALLCLSLVSLVFGQASLHFDPPNGSVGSTVVARVTGLEPGVQAQLVWAGAEAGWNVGDGEFHGVEATETRTPLAEGAADSAGNLTLQFAVPEGYGYLHDVFVTVNGQQAARQGFTVVPTFSIEPTSGPVGTPITVTMTGVGYKFWESVWQLAYDGAHSGWLSAITTAGTAVAVIPATGAPGTHTLQVISGTHPVPYLNQQQSPNFNPAIPTVLGALFEVTGGPPVMPVALVEQQVPRAPGGLSAAGEGDGPSLSADFASGIVGSPISLTGSGFPANTEVWLGYDANRGNRLSGRGWEVGEFPLGTVTTDADGAFTFTTTTPDDLGGEHNLIAAVADDGSNLRAETTYVITPSVTFSPSGPVEPGGEIVVTIKGVGWTETANIYTLLLDNGYLGYGCGFNSHGDVTIYLRAPGQSGWHFISLYPAIYQGELTGPGAPASTATANATYLQIPMLHFQDHPGEELPAFHLAFEVR